MSFKESVLLDNARVFLNLSEFAEPHTIVYDGETYADVPCVLTKTMEKNRVTTMRDHAQGLYVVSAVLHCAKDSLGGIVPEKGGRIKVSDGGFLRTFYVAQSDCEVDMIRLELEAYDE